jgi:hypothetical protein
VRRPALLKKLARQFRIRVQAGVTAGRISDTELGRLRSQRDAIRTRVETLRQSGTKPTVEERRAIRQAIRQLSRDIYAANHGELAN